MAMTAKPLAKEVAELLLLAKTMIDKIRVQTGSPDRHSLALNILLAHDAAELALAAIANQLGRLPKGSKQFLMDYFEPLKSLHPKKDVAGKGYFDQLNTVRNNLKHKGIFPDVQQWARVGENVYAYMSGWCSKYLKLALDELNESVLLEDGEAKNYYNEAKAAFVKGEYKNAMEKLALALHSLFCRNAALPLLPVGVPKAEDAIRLAAFGVHANDFLTLQGFLPRVLFLPEKPIEIRWVQAQHGHPGNWREEAARFCVKAFLDIALKIQSAPSIPGPIHFSLVYEHKIESLRDGVEIWNLPERQPNMPAQSKFFAERKPIRTLNKGEILRGSVSSETREASFLTLADYLAEGARVLEKEELSISCGPPYGISGYVARADIRITCVPREDERVKGLFPGLPALPEIEWDNQK